MLDKKFRSDLLFGYLTQAGSMGCSFLFSTLLVRYAGVSVFGQFALLGALSSVLDNLLTLRTSEAVIVFFKQGEAAGQPGRGKFALLAGMALDLVVGLLLFLAVYSQADLIAGMLMKSSEVAADVRLYAWLLLLQSAGTTPVAYLMVRENFKVMNLLAVGNWIGKVGTVAFLYLQAGQLDLRKVVIAALAPSVLFLAAEYFYLLWAILIRMRKIPILRDARVTAEYVRFSANTFISSTLKAGTQNLDTLILGYLTNPESAGVYGIFRQFIAPFPILSNPLSGLMFPKFAKAVAERRHQEVRAMVLKVNRKLVLIYLALGALIVPGLLGYAWWVQLKIGAWSVVAFCLLIAAAMINNQQWWARPFSNAVNPSISLRANLYAAVSSVLLLVPLTYFFGLLGTAMSVLTLAFGLSIYWGRVFLHLGEG